MVQLGSSFPDDTLREFIEKNLKPGCVVRLVVRFPHITKPKYMILIATDDPEYLTFIVNSTVHSFIQNRPDLLRCQVKVDLENHTFMDHDSYAACHDVWPIQREDVIQALMADISGLKGNISDDVRLDIVAAIKNAKTIDRVKKDHIIAQMMATNTPPTK